MAAEAQLTAAVHTTSIRRPSRVKVIKVFVCAGSAAELEGLEAVVRSAAGLELVGSNLGGVDLAEEVEGADPDVLLRRVYAASLSESGSGWDDTIDLPTVLIVEQSEFDAAVAAMQGEDSAIRGVLPGWASDREIQIALEAAATGLLILHGDIAEQTAHAANTPSPSATEVPGEALSPREREVLDLLAVGLGNKEIAWRLKISDHTVKFHVTSIFNKLSVSSRAEAVAVGIRRGLIAL